MTPKIYRFAEVDSTQDIAKELAEKGAEEGSVIVAEKQRKGRGRMGREWFSPAGGVFLSVIFKPSIEANEAARVTLIAGLAIAKAIRKYGIEAKVKLPNDVLIRGKKVCGILTEAKAKIEKYHSLNYLILGIGVNLNIDAEDFPPSLRGTSTSLKIEVEKELSKEEFIHILLEELFDAYLLT